MSMQFQFQQPVDAEGSDLPYVTKGGFYHVEILAQDPQPLNRGKTEYLDGLGVTFNVLAGTHPDQFDKTYDEVFIKGNPNQKDKGNFCNRKLFKLFVAAGLLGEHSPGAETSLNTNLMVGRQVVIELEEKPNSANAKNPHGTHVEFKGDHVFHVDDPAVKDVPMHPEALALIPAELRRHPSSFKTEGSTTATATATQPEQTKPKLSVAQVLNRGAVTPPITAPVDTADV